MASRENCCNSRNTFWGLFALTQCFGIATLILLISWNLADNNGYVWGQNHQWFAIHPLVMILSLVYLYGLGALVYRVLDFLSRKVLMWIHMVIMAVILTLAVFGIVLVFLYHNVMDFGNMYTMHSWCGMVNMVAFGLQFGFGFVILLWPKGKGWMQNMYLPIHRFCNFAVLALTLASIISGVLDDMFFCMGHKKYHKLPLQARVFNVVGILCMCYILLVMYLTYRDDWKRRIKRKSPSEDTESPTEEPTTSKTSSEGSTSDPASSSASKPPISATTAAPLSEKTGLLSGQ